MNNIIRRISPTWYCLSFISLKIVAVKPYWIMLTLKPKNMEYVNVVLLQLKYVSVSSNIRVLHMLVVVADNGLTGAFRLAWPHWNNMARLSCHAKYPNPRQMYAWVICFEINCTWKQMSYRIMFAYRYWPEIQLIDGNLLVIPASFVGCSKRSQSNCTCSHANVRREICQDSQHQFHR